MLLSLLVPLCAAAAPSSVGLDLTELAARDFERLDALAFEKSAVVRLVQDGFAVVAPTEAADVLIRLEVQPVPRALVLRARGPGGEAAREVPWGKEPLAELHLELTQKLVELTRQVARAAPAPVPVVEPDPPEPAPAPAAPEPTPVVAAPPPAPPRRFSFGAAAGVLTRPGGADALVLARARYGTTLRGVAELGIAFGRGTGVTVVETQLAVGPAIGLALTDSLELEVAALVGGLLHAFWFDDSSTDAAAGARINVLLMAPVTLSYQLSPDWGLFARLAAGWAQARVHLSGDVAVWSRAPFRVEAAVGLRSTF